MHDPHTVPALKRLLAVKSTPEYTEESSIWVLGHLGNKAAVDILLGLLKSPEEQDTQLLVIQALRSAGEPRAIRISSPY